MKRTAVVSPYALGALSAYRVVIKDISRVLGDPNVDVAKLFFAVMIQAGLQRFSVSPKPGTDVLDSSLLAGRICSTDYSKIETDLNEIRKSIVHSTKSKSPDKQDRRDLHDLASFVQDLHIASVFKRPVATVVAKPDVEAVRRILRDDVAIVLEALLHAVQTITVDSPVARFDVPGADLKAFREVMASDVFEPYVDGHAMFEAISHSPEGILKTVEARAKTVVGRFPTLTDLKETSIQVIDSVPSLLDATVGKAFGAAAKPFASALTKAIGQERRLVVYSFYPTWRRLWDSKLDKVRVLVAEERAATNRKSASS